MAQKQPPGPADIAKIKLEPKEDAQLQAEMGDKGSRARASMAFRYWVQNKANPEERALWDSSDMDVKGKQQMLLRWLVWRSRNFNIDTQQQTVVGLSTSRSSRSRFSWMSKEQMENVKGVKKTAIRTASNKLEQRPCRTTGSTDPDAVEYKAAKTQCQT